MTLRFTIFGFACVFSAAMLYGCSSSTTGPGPNPAPTGDLLWAASYGEHYDDQLSSISADPSGNIILTGTFNGSINFGGGPLTASQADAFLVKLDPDGHHLFSRALGDATLTTTATARAGSQGEVYLLTWETPVWGGPDAGPPPETTTWLRKLDPSGAEAWKKPMFSASGGFNRLSVESDPRGGYVLSGAFQGDLDLGDGTLHGALSGTPFVAAYDAEGHLRFKRTFPASTGTFGLGVAVGPSGEVAITGGFEGSLPIDGTTLVSQGIDDVFLLSLDPDGDVLFLKQFGTSDQDFAGGVSVGPDGEVLMMAELSEGSQLGAEPLTGPPGSRGVVAVFEPSGDLRFVTETYTLFSGFLTGGKLDVYGDLILASMSSSTDDPKLSVTSLDPTGALLWQHTYGQHGEIESPAIAVDGSGAVLLGATQWATVDMGSGPLTLTGNGWAALVAKLAP